jgi:hypothetical protein
MTASDAVLACALEVAVPLRIMELLAMSPAKREPTMNGWRSKAVEAVASEGDILMYRSKKSGESARVFNHLARGLAVLAGAPGGVLFSGRHWCLEHVYGKQADSISEFTCDVTWPEHRPQRARPTETVQTTEVF